MNDKIFWIDIESTGLDFRRHDIIQLSYLIEINKEIKEEGNFYVQPFNYDTIEKAALEVNKLEISQIKTFPEPKEIYNKIKGILEKYIDRYNKNDKFSMAGYNNTNFDVPFLKQFFIKNNDRYFGAFFNYHILDVFPLLFALEYKGLIKLDNFKLITVCKHFGIELKAHDALSDIKATRELFNILLTYFK